MRTFKQPRRGVPSPHRRLCTLAFCTLALIGTAAFPATRWTTVSEPAQLPGAARTLGDMASGTPVHIVVGMQLRHRDRLERLISEQSRPGSPAYHQTLSAREFEHQFAPSAANARAVADYLRTQGFVNVTVAPNRMLVSADGSAGVIKSAFNTVIKRLSIRGHRAFANASSVQMPKALANDVTAVLGLQNIAHFHTLYEQAKTANPKPLGLFGSSRTRGFNPNEFPKAYGVASTPDARNTTVGVITAGDLSQTLSDLDQFQQENDLPSIPVDVVPAGPPGSANRSGTAEFDLDTQNIQAMAGGRVRQMLLFNATSLTNADITAAYNAALDDGGAKLVNVSLGLCERSAKRTGTLNTDDQIFMAAAAQGIIFSVASGDSGSHECPTLLKTRRNARQSYPASSPFVVAVGGTTLTVDADGNYADETAWQRGGGGPSTVEDKPAYQNGIVPGSGRGVPDIALDADPASGAIIIVRGDKVQAGGTSLAAPLFVGLYARILSANGNDRGFVTPSFYRFIPDNPSLVHDVTEGSNGGFNPYTAQPGWDFTTGFGSPVIGALNDFVSAHGDF